MKLRIKELRKNLGLTGEQLGDVLGVSKSYISELETGKKTPGAALLMKMSETFSCDVADLFEGSEGDRSEAELQAHLVVMSQLSPEDRAVIERAALGLLSKQRG